jgi:DNA-binding transcriptional ArsR family regulator
MTPDSTTAVAPTPPSEAALFHALSDSTRRAIFERVCERPQPVGALAAGLPVSRPAVSQHLKVLRSAGLVRADQRDTRRIYSADPKGLERLRAWAERHWEVVLESFARAAEGAESEARRREAETSESPKGEAE